MYQILLTNVTLLLHSKKTKRRQAKTANQQLLPHAEDFAKKIKFHEEMRAKRSSRFLPDKSSISLQQGGNLDAAYQSQMNGHTEVRTSRVPATHKPETMAVRSSVPAG